MCKKDRFVFALYLRQMVPKEAEGRCKKEETLEMFTAVLRNRGPVLVKDLWSGELPCESASLKDFSFCLSLPLKHEEMPVQKSPLCIFWVWRVFEGEESRILRKVYTCRNTDQPFTFSKVVWKLHSLWRVCTPRPTSLCYPATCAGLPRLSANFSNYRLWKNNSAVKTLSC